MIVDSLKKSILQQAFQGNLSIRKKSDSNIKETIKNILKIKEEKIKNKIYKGTPKGKEISDNDKQYKIPSTWEWVRLIDLCSVITCGYASTPQYVSNGMPFLSAKNVKPFEFKPNDYKLIDKELYEKLTTTCKPEINDILLTRVGAGIGESAIIDVKMDFAIYVSLTLIKLVDYNLINNKYILYWLNSPYGIRTSINNITGKKSSQGNLNVHDVRNFLIPLPPIEEQQRIVDKIEELFAKLDEIKPIEEKLNSLKEQFPIKFKNSILNSAIKGELVLNNPLEKAVFEISTYDKKIFEVPRNWRWMKLMDCVLIRTGLSFKKIDQVTVSNTALRILRGGNINNDYTYSLKDDDIYVNWKDNYIELKEGDILTPSVTSMEQMGKDAYIDRNLPNVTAGGFVYIIRSIDKNKVLPKYILYYINSNFHKELCKPNINKSGQAFYNLKKSGLEIQPIPIPPIEEQQRIVDKLEQLLPLCDDITNIVEELNDD